VIIACSRRCGYAVARFGKLTVCAKAEGKVKPTMLEALPPRIEYAK